eukprot:432917-Pyramimonas_sp.AAC.1
MDLRLRGDKRSINSKGASEPSGTLRHPPSHSHDNTFKTSGLSGSWRERRRPATHRDTCNA